ncbi:MAG: FCD domain-containing protein, partial [Spirochaetota bacterium]|nr:FCD domain-containing protein [Spirochaetota bacterium]
NKVEELYAIGKDHNYQEIIDGNSMFHSIINNSFDNQRLKQYIKMNEALATLSRTNEFYMFHRENDYLDEHKAILLAIEKRDPERAELSMKMHIMHDLSFFKEHYQNTFSQSLKQ